MVKGTAAKRLLLVVDDEPENLEFLERIFRDDFEVHSCADGTSALEAISTMQPDVVISDQRMPEMTGVELLKSVREHSPETIRVLITGYTDFEALVEATNEARIGHIFEKPCRPSDVRAVVSTLLRNRELEREQVTLTGKLEAANTKLGERERILEELVSARTSDLEKAVSQLAAANRDLAKLATRDALTGLYNRRYLLEALDREVARSRRHERQFGLLFADVDDFKKVNDNLGHQVGDAVLRTMASMLTASGGSRLSDVAGRYGGEEFCLVLPETPLDGACVKADRIIRLAREFDWTTIHADLWPVTVSVGVAIWPEHGGSSGSLLKSADHALYAAKHAGKNQACVAETVPEASN